MTEFIDMFVEAVTLLAQRFFYSVLSVANRDSIADNLVISGVIMLALWVVLAHVADHVEEES